MAEFELNLVPDGNLEPAGTDMAFEHGEFNLNIVPDGNLEPAGDGLFFTHGDFSLDLVPLGDGGGAPTEFYRMRAFDQTLASIVYWTATEVDSDGSEYTGPGPLVDIVLHYTFKVQ